MNVRQLGYSSLSLLTIASFVYCADVDKCTTAEHCNFAIGEKVFDKSNEELLENLKKYCEKEKQAQLHYMTEEEIAHYNELLQDYHMTLFNQLRAHKECSADNSCETSAYYKELLASMISKRETFIEARNRIESSQAFKLYHQTSTAD